MQNNSFADSQMLTVGFSRMLGRKTSQCRFLIIKTWIQDSDGAYFNAELSIDRRRSAQLT